MDQKTLILLVVGVIVPFLAFLFKVYAFGNEQKLWIEFVFSIIGGVAVMFFTGTIPALPSAGEPVAFLQALGPVVAAIFAVAVLVYTALQEQLVTKAASLKAARGK